MRSHAALALSNVLVLSAFFVCMKQDIVRTRATLGQARWAVASLAVASLAVAGVRQACPAHLDFAFGAEKKRENTVFCRITLMLKNAKKTTTPMPASATATATAARG